MHYYEVAPERIVRLDSDTLTYHAESTIQKGTIVKIPVGKKMMRGVILRTVKKPSYATKQLAEIAYEIPIPGEHIDLALWMNKYYQTPLATIIKMLLPKNLEVKRRLKEKTSKEVSRNRTNILFNLEQQQAIDRIDAINHGSVILQGVTGSGKTEVYFETITKTISEGRSAMLLIPEISLSTQLIAEAKHKFSNIVVFHSGITESQRHKNWLQVINSIEPLLIIGARSALFAPVKNLGVIILDECHDSSYHQDSSPRYSALRVASVLGSLHKSKVIYGSATPSVAERFIAEQNKRPVILMSSKAISNTKEASVSVIDMRLNSNHTKHKYLSDKLLSSIEENIASGKQTIIFHNRRGSQGITLCENCGWQAICKRCHIPIILHSDDYYLECKICRSKERVPKSCPQCNSATIIHKALGTKQIENDLKKLFPKARISRFDSDNKKENSLSEKYQELYDGQIDIAIGTQILAKGLDLPNLTLVGIIQAENGLALPDFSSTERIFQLLYQVSGRVGRNGNNSEVVVQTYLPDHPSVIYGVNQNYEEFYKYSIDERKLGNFPPFVYLLKATCSYKTEKGAINAARNLMLDLRKANVKGIDIQGPFPSFYEKIRDNYRWQILVKSKERSKLQELSKFIPASKWQIDFDTPSLL